MSTTTDALTSDQQAALDALTSDQNAALDAACRAYYNARDQGSTPEQAAMLPAVRDALTVVYAPCDANAPLDSREFENHCRLTIHLARWVNDRRPIPLHWLDAWQPDRLNDTQRRLLASWRGTSRRGTASSGTIPTGSGTVPTGRAPDPELWNAACVNVPEIALAANRRLGLPSASEHDLSLATRLRQLDWTRQQIVDLLWWNRRKRGEDLKHPGYYTRTVDLAVRSAR